MSANWCKVLIGKSSQDLQEIEDKTIHLMVTSPCYPMIEMWDDLFIKIHGVATYDEMHLQLVKTWKEIYRVLVDGGIACINIGDATRTINGIFQLFPNHARIIQEMQKIGFITLPYILWKKPTTKPNAFLGSGFFPPNAYITQDCEFILIFRKGKLRTFPPKDPNRYKSTYTKEERDRWFSQIWQIPGVRQKIEGFGEKRVGAFPLEIPLRLIKMFSLKGEVILDPFLGTGTTCLAAMETERNSIGCEITRSLKPIILKKLEKYKHEVEIIE
jgi:site-specific DNA-methyltransferase (cytosine-N4-specific)